MTQPLPDIDTDPFSAAIERAGAASIDLDPLGGNPKPAPDPKPDPKPAPEHLSDDPAPITSGRLITKGELIDLADFAARRAEKFAQTLATLTAGATAKGEDVAVSLAAAGFDRKAAADAAAKAAERARKEIVAASSETRWADLRALAAAADGLATTEALYASPQAVLARAGLGDARRTDLMNQLAGAGPAVLRQMATLAIATKDPILGAAVMSVNDRLTRRERPISSAELADALVGEETRAVSSAIASIKLAAQRAIVANREFESGRVRTVDRVKIGLAANQLKETD